MIQPLRRRPLYGIERHQRYRISLHQTQLTYFRAFFLAIDGVSGIPGLMPTPKKVEVLTN